MAASPGERETVSIADLVELYAQLSVALVKFPDDNGQRALEALHATITTGRSSDERLRVLLAMGATAGQQARERQEHSLGVLSAPFMFDPDPTIASTATFQIVSLYPPDDDEPLSVVKSVISMSLDLDDQDRRATILGALLAMGHETPTRLLDGCGQGIDRKSRSSFAQTGSELSLPLAQSSSSCVGQRQQPTTHWRRRLERSPGVR